MKQNSTYVEMRPAGRKACLNPRYFDRENLHCNSDHMEILHDCVSDEHAVDGGEERWEDNKGP